MTTANLNLEENAQRKAILNAMLGTRVFRGSALSRAVRGNSPGGEPAPPASSSQINSYGQLVVAPSASLVDQRESSTSGSGSTPAGGTGAGGGGYGAAGGQSGAGRTGRL